MVELITAMVALTTTLAAGLIAYAKLMAKVRGIDDAVNRRHEKRGEGAPKMYDMVWENHASLNDIKNHILELRIRSENHNGRIALLEARANKGDQL